MEAQHLDYLKQIYKGMGNQEIADLMNKKFGTNYSSKQIMQIKYRKGLKSGYGRFVHNHQGCLDFITENYPKMTVKELAEKFNEKYGTNMSGEAIRQIKRRYKLPTPNKDVQDRFKKGNTNQRKPIGSEWIKSTNGEIYIKIANPDVWVLKKKYVYEQVYGKLPDNYQVICKNGNNKDIRPENLLAIKQADLLFLNFNKLFKKNPELLKTGILISRVASKRRQLELGGKNERHNI